MMKIVSRSIFAVRSGLIAFQLPPRSVDRKRTFAAVYATPGVTLEKRIGVSHSQRYGLPSGPTTLRDSGLRFADVDAGSRHDSGREKPGPGFTDCDAIVARLTRRIWARSASESA